ncbi:MAG: SDR family NAD(P)-dependent oxidoreductase [Verrucomicrobiales bacterium]|nr:SDR family NAD(P)-dependent oxidoreductase [Verrucomicrobiales bacterium]
MKKIVITGCSRGLGLAMARGFQQLGHEVFGCSGNPESIAKLEDPDHFSACDVADNQAVEAFAASFLEKNGAPDLLINNAALINRNAPLWQVPTDEFARVMEVNVIGVTNMIRHFVPAMITAGSGVIVNFSSYWGRSVSSDVTPYCASKWAIEGLTRGLAQDLPSGLAAVALNPGVIHTDMLQSCFGPGAAAYLSPKEWAESAVPFIAGFDASNNGDSVTVPGQ